MPERSTTLDLPAMAAPGTTSARDQLRAYLELAKPGIVRMVIVAMAVGFVMGAIRVAGTAGTPITATQFFVTGALAILGTALSAAGANALNMVMEVSRDGCMGRTSSRPLPSGRLGRREATIAGLAMSLSGVLVLASGVGAGAAAVSATVIVTYLLCYTPLKPITTWSTVVGAFPGALPPLVGWCAASTMHTGSPWTGVFEPGGWSLVALMFVWQVPHVMAISWKYKDEYNAGGYRVLPSIDPTGRRTATASLAWSVALIPISLLPIVVMPPGVLGVAYAAAAVALGGVFLAAAYRMAIRRTPASAVALFVVSIVYLPLLLFVMVVDALAGGIVPSIA